MFVIMDRIYAHPVYLCSNLCYGLCYKGNKLLCYVNQQNALFKLMF
jgi:hypothetical protein